MKQEKLYVYTGDNGTITTPVYLEGIPCVKKIRLIADDGKVLTNGTTETQSIVVAESQVASWSEIKDEGQE